MKVKQKGERIHQSYLVLHSFPFVYGVLYYTICHSKDGEQVNRFIHAIPWDQENKDYEKLVNLLQTRNKKIFIPISEVFQEDGVLYQVYEKIEGDLFGIYLHRNAPLPLEEATQYLMKITEACLKNYGEKKFFLISPQNMVIDPQKQIRFLYGGPMKFLPHARGAKELAEWEAEDVKDLAELVFFMLSGKSVDQVSAEERSLQAFCSDVPDELEALFQQALLPKREERPTMQQFLDWAKNPTRVERQTEIEEATDSLEENKIDREPKTPSFAQNEEVQHEEILASEFSQNPSPVTPSPQPSSPLTHFAVSLPTHQPKSEEEKKKARKALVDRVFYLAMGVLAVIFVYQVFFSSPDPRQVAAGILSPNVEQNEAQAEKWFQLAKKAFEQGDLKTAIEYARKAVDADVSKKEYFMFLADLYGHNKEYAKSVQVLEAATKAFEDDPNFYDALAIYAYYLGDYQKAKNAIETAIELNKNDADFYFHQGKIYKKLGLNEQAIEAFKQVEKIDPKNPLGNHELAVYFTALNRLDEAIEYGKKAVNIRPKDPKFRITLGIIYLKKLDETREDLQLSDEEKKVEINQLLEDALQQFDQAVPYDQTGEAYYYKSRVHFLRRELNLAIQAIQQAILQDPNNPLYYYQLGIYAMEAKQKQEAITALQKAVELDPVNGDYQEKLAEAKALK